MPLDTIFDTKLFDDERASQSAGWARELAGIHTPETEQYGIASFVYRSRRPFHPARLQAFLGSELPGVLRSKGFFWLATRMADVGAWSQAGAACHTGRAGFWWAAIPEENWPKSDEGIQQIRARWQSPYGDRRQEIVMIGASMDEQELRREFDRCLLTDEELAAGPRAWRRLPDPFPRWGPGLVE